MSLQGLLDGPQTTLIFPAHFGASTIVNVIQRRDGDKAGAQHGGHRVIIGDHFRCEKGDGEELREEHKSE